MEEGMNLIKIYCNYVCKYHSVSPWNNYYMLIKKKKEKSKNLFLKFGLDIKPD
jgi:hypothetical protein